MPLAPPQKSLITKLTTPNPDSTRKASQRLRIACPDFAQRVILGRAYRNGWCATTLIDLAGTFDFIGRRGRGPCNAAYHKAIQIGAERVYDASLPWNAHHMMPKAPAPDSDWPPRLNNKKKR